MARPSRTILFFAASLAVLAAADAATGKRTVRKAVPRAAAAAVIKPTPPNIPWAQTTSDVPVDKSIRFGTLPNGMKYALMHSATPPGKTSLRLQIGAGSFMERDDQLGLAHFMEHMAFNGTTNIPKNELIADLERLGLAFGADLNAATSYDQTFYMLDMPKSDGATLDTGLTILLEQASEATMDPDDIDGERGVIAGEERLRNSPGYRIGQRQLKIFANGLKLANRSPIGDLSIINTAKRDKFVDFYRTYYRPSRATLVAVGDFDVDAMEAAIKAKFGGWRPKAPDVPDPDLGKVLPRKAETHLLVEPGAPSAVSLTWIKQPDLRPDTMAKQRELMVRRLGTAVFNRRMKEIADADNPPFVGASMSEGSALRSIGLAGVTAQFVEGKAPVAVAALEQEQRRFVQFGVTRAELDREINTLRTRLRKAVASRNTRQTASLANDILGTLSERTVVTTPETDLELFEQVVKTLTPEAVNVEMKKVFSGYGPIFVTVSPKDIEGGEPGLTAALDASRRQQVAANVAKAPVPWAYTDFGTPGTVISKEEIPGFGATRVKFANGTQLIVKPTPFTKESIQVNVQWGLGSRAFSPNVFSPMKEAVGSLRSGGLGKMTQDQVDYAFNGRNVVMGSSTGDGAFNISGFTNPADFKVEMQLIAAHLTDPAFRPQLYNLSRKLLPSVVDASRASPEGVWKVDVQPLLADGDKREAIPPADLVASKDYDIDSFRPALLDLIKKGPLTVIVVGDTTVDDAIKVTAPTLGALPTRPDEGAPAPGATVRRFPAGTPQPLVFYHKGAAEQGLGVISFPTTDYTKDPSEVFRVSLLAAVLKLRVIDEIREKEALAYAPQVGEDYSDVFEGYGHMDVQAATAPEKLPAFFAAMDEVLRKLRDTPISEDELKRAREPLVARARQNRESNPWWMLVLSEAANKPGWVANGLGSIDILNAMTPADVQTLAKKYFVPERAWKAEILPETAKK